MNNLITLELPNIPPTVNHLYRTGRNGQRYKTQEGRNYQDETTACLQEVWSDAPSCTESVAVFIEFTTSTRRKWDIDNRVKALLDCLELAGVIANDSQIDMPHVERVKGKADSTKLTVALNNVK